MLCFSLQPPELAPKPALTSVSGPKPTSQSQYEHEKTTYR